MKVQQQHHVAAALRVFGAVCEVGGWVPCVRVWCVRVFLVGSERRGEGPTNLSPVSIELCGDGLVL